jgi:Leucine-rich repeat (LRR) protein
LKNVETKTVDCEKIETPNWIEPVGTVNTCYMLTTTIDEPDTTISTHDSSMGGLDVKNNKKAKFLLVQVVERFPNLKAYSASNCSIKEISKENFAGLNKLKHLSLDNNQIERIESGTFQDLVLLENLFLRKIKVTFKFSNS